MKARTLKYRQQKAGQLKAKRDRIKRLSKLRGKIRRQLESEWMEDIL